MGVNARTVLKVMSSLSSFAPDKTRRASFYSDEIAFGRYENDADHHVVFSNLGIRLIISGAEVFVSYDDICEAAIPVIWDRQFRSKPKPRDWNKMLIEDSSVRELRLSLFSGEVVLVSFSNSSEGMDIFNAHSLLRKVAFFNRNQLRIVMA